MPLTFRVYNKFGAKLSERCETISDVWVGFSVHLGKVRKGNWGVPL